MVKKNNDECPNCHELSVIEGECYNCGFNENEIFDEGEMYDETMRI